MFERTRTRKGFALRFTRAIFALALLGSGCTSYEERALRALIAQIDAELAQRASLLAQLEALEREASLQRAAVVQLGGDWLIDEKIRALNTGEISAQSSLELAETIARRPVLVDRIQNRGGRWTALIRPLPQTKPVSTPKLAHFNFRMPKPGLLRWGDERALIAKIEARRKGLAQLRELRQSVRTLDGKLRPFRPLVEQRRQQADLMRAFFEHREKTFPDLSVVRDDARLIVSSPKPLSPQLAANILKVKNVALKANESSLSAD